MEDIVKLFISAFLSALLGLEREVHKKPAGLKTHILVGVGSTILTILSYKYFPGGDPSRIASYILPGIGFIGAGTIMKEENRVIGLTTAASLWLVSAIGIAVGVEAFDLAVTGALIGLITLLLTKVERKLES